jgi:hypothetical protein
MPNRRVSSVLLVALIVVAGVAFLHAEQLKLERSPVARPLVPKFVSTACPIGSPTCARHAGGVRVGVVLRDPGTVSLAIVDTGGHVVDTVLAPRAERRGPVVAVWPVRTSAGTSVPEGTYHLQVGLHSLGRTITIPNPMVVDDTPPTLRITSPAGALPITYQESEHGRAYASAVPEGGASVPVRCRGGRVLLRATSSLPAGTIVTLHMIAVDRAGNRSQPLVVTGVRVPA